MGEAAEWVKAGMPVSEQDAEFSFWNREGCDSEHIEGMIFNYFGWCGCADVLAMAEYLLATFDEIERRFSADATRPTPNYAEGPFPDALTLTDGSRYLIWCLMDDKGWLEHGSSVRGSWLTDEAKDVARPLLKWVVERERELDEEPK